jgi:hypothetical protein
VAAIVRTLPSHVAESSIFMWFVLATGGAAAVSWGVASVIRRSKRRSRRAFLVASAFSQKYYVAAFVQRLHSTFDRDGIDLVLKVPDRDYHAKAAALYWPRLARLAPPGYPRFDSNVARALDNELGLLRACMKFTLEPTAARSSAHSNTEHNGGAPDRWSHVLSWP